MRKCRSGHLEISVRRRLAQHVMDGNDQRESHRGLDRSEHYDDEARPFAVGFDQHRNMTEDVPHNSLQFVLVGYIFPDKDGRIMRTLILALGHCCDDALISGVKRTSRFSVHV